MLFYPEVGSIKVLLPKIKECTERWMLELGIEPRVAQLNLAD
jgi:hypothetical protein